MKHKILKAEGCETCKELVLFQDVNERGEIYIRLVAWHLVDGDPYIQESSIYVKGENTSYSLRMLDCVIEDFSEVSALEFLLLFKE